MSARVATAQWNQAPDGPQRFEANGIGAHGCWQHRRAASERQHTHRSSIQGCCAHYAQWRASAATGSSDGSCPGFSGTTSTSRASTIITNEDELIPTSEGAWPPPLLELSSPHPHACLPIALAHTHWSALAGRCAPMLVVETAPLLRPAWEARARRASCSRKRATRPRSHTAHTALGPSPGPTCPSTRAKA